MARMNLKWRAILAGLFIIAVFAAACGGGGKGGSSSKGSDEDQIKQTVADFANAFNTGKADDAYNLMDAASRKACSQQDVATLLTLMKTLSGNGKFTAEASDIKVTGDKATAKVTAAIGGKKEDPETDNLVKENGKWKLSFATSSEDCGA